MSKGEKKTKVVGVAFTAKGRERKAKQAVIGQTGARAEDLRYVEDKTSNTARVENRSTGRSDTFKW